jgi:crotonyl-CoA carboxylase/reductase
VAVDIAEVAKLDVEPGTLPEKMAAWVIRQEREGEPKDAFQVEEVDVPEPGAFEVIVRVMAAGVNFNNVWAALGKPVSVTIPSTGITSADPTRVGSSGRSARA